MKLNLPLSLALASTVACAIHGSAYSLSPVRSTASGSSRRGGSSTAFGSTTTNANAHVTTSSTALSSSSSSLASTTDASNNNDAAAITSAPRGGSASSVIAGIDIPLIAYFGLWYLGNYYYNITNKMALKATGGAAGFPLTISALQLGIGSLYGIFLWLAPDAREKPKVTFDDVSNII
jgi:solute carrier family 35 protein E1